MVGFRCAFFFWGAKGRFSRVFALSFRECNTKDWEMQLVRNGDLCWPLLIGIFDGKCTEVLHHLGYFRWKEWDIYGYLTYRYKILWPNSTTQTVVGFPTPTSTPSTPKIGWWNCRTSLTNWTLGTCLLVFLVCLVCFCERFFRFSLLLCSHLSWCWLFWWSVPKNDWVFWFFCLVGTRNWPSDREDQTMQVKRLARASGLGTCPRIPWKALEGEPPPKKKKKKKSPTTTTTTTTKKKKKKRRKISISAFREKKRCWFVRGVSEIKEKDTFWPGVES